LQSCKEKRKEIGKILAHVTQPVPADKHLHVESMLQNGYQLVDMHINWDGLNR